MVTNSFNKKEEKPSLLTTFLIQRILLFIKLTIKSIEKSSSNFFQKGVSTKPKSCSKQFNQKL